MASEGAAQETQVMIGARLNTAAESGQMVKFWVPDADPHELWRLVDVSGPGSKPGTASIVTASGDAEEVELTVAHAHDASHDLDLDDVCDMVDLHEAPLLAMLRRRWQSGRIYTAAGRVLCSINPYKTLPAGLYDIPSTLEAMERRFGCAAGGARAPHLFAWAHGAHAALLRGGDGPKMNQAMIVNGESGAGKTMASTLIIEYLAALAARSRGAEDAWDAAKVVATTPALEAFGNAKTAMNDNSSRFGKFVLLEYVYASSALVGAQVEDFLLEKSRVAQTNVGERTFHAFYQLCAAPGAAAEFGVGNAADHAYTAQQDVTIADVDDGAEAVTTAEAFAALGDGGEFVAWQRRVVAGVLRLGDVEFDDEVSGEDGMEDESVVVEATLRALGDAAAALQVDAAALSGALHHRTIYIAGDQKTIAYTAHEAAAVRDALAKALYDRLFAHVVAYANASLRDGLNDGDSQASVSSDSDDGFVVDSGRNAVDDEGEEALADSGYIGILDIYGFEIMDVNSLDQLLINFANETLQVDFTNHVLVAEISRYEEEGIVWEGVNLADSQRCLDLIAKAPDGILVQLDEQVKLGARGSDLNFLGCIDKLHGGTDKLHGGKAAHANYAKPRFDRAGFIIKHYAGDVQYAAHGFLVRNVDPLSEDLAAVVRASGDAAVSAWYPAAPPGEGARQQQRRTLAESTSRKFREQMARLALELRDCEKHFVRCLRPNSVRSPELFDSDLVLRQLRFFGVLDIVKIRRLGFPEQRSAQDFWAAYCRLLPDGASDKAWEAFAQLLPPTVPLEGGLWPVYQKHLPEGEEWSDWSEQREPLHDGVEELEDLRTKAASLDDAKKVAALTAEIADARAKIKSSELAPPKVSDASAMLCAMVLSPEDYAVGGTGRLYLKHGVLQKLDEMLAASMGIEISLGEQRQKQLATLQHERVETVSTATVRLQTALRAKRAKAEFRKERDAANLLGRVARARAARRAAAALAKSRDDAVAARLRAAQAAIDAAAAKHQGTIAVVYETCGLADDGACHIAAGLVGHGTLVRLDLNENNIGELGCAGLAKALLGNGVLAHLSLAANRVDSHGAGHLARAVRLSGALLSLELGNNPLIGAVGAKHLGEALAGGSADLLSRLEAEAPLARTERFRVTLQSLGEDGVGSDDDDGTAPQAKGPRRGRGKSARGGALEHLGLAECDVMRGRNVAGVCALASGLERGGALTSLDLSRCDMSDFGASELAQALRGALGRSRLVVLRLQGNSSLSPRWADRDSYVKLTHQGTIADDPIFNPDDDTTQSSTRTTTTQSSKSRGTADRHNLVPTIATSLELNRRDVARDAKERGEPVRGSRASLSLDEGSVSSLDNDSASAVSMVSMASVRRGSAPPEKKRSKLLTVPPAPAADKATGRLEGEWTNGWLAQEDRVEAKAARAEAVARADEASRQRLEEDAVDAACAAAGAATWLALLQPPDGPKLLAAVVAELREAGALAKKVAAAAPKRKVDTRAVAHATLAVVDDVESVSTLATDQLETKVAAQTPRSFAALLAEAVVPRGKVTLAVDAKTDSGPAPAEAVVAGRRAPRRGAVVDPAAAHLRAVFMRVDVDDSGGIDASELPALLSRLGWKHMSKKALQEMMGKIDGNSSGAIDFQELCSWYFTGGRKEIRNAKRRPAFFQGGEGDAVELNADALKQLVAEARAAAQVSARAAYRSRFPTRGNCVCAVCGVAALDVGAAAKHYDAATATREISAHVIWRKKAAANFRRAQMLDRARASVARQARGKEGRSTSTAAGNVAANADEVSSQFPVLLVYHPEVQHFIDLQTYDIPDSLLGRPTGALTLHASAVFCVGDGHGNAECAGAGAEWLRILMPPHVERAWAPDAARSALMAAEAVAAARHGASLRELFVDGGEERAPLRRAVVWLRNRSLEYAHGKKSVLVPLRPGPTPLDRSEADLRKDIELGICDVGGKKLKVKPPSKPPSKLATLLRAATFQTGAARRDVEKRAEAAHLKRLKILGEHAEYVVDTRSLRSGPQIVLWARPRWYRVAPALHRRTRLKVRAVPEAYAHVLGDVGWGDAILAYGRGGDWLIGAFGDRDNAWFLEKSPRRALLHLVGSTVQLKTLRARGVSPQTIELGATAKGTIVSQAPARLQAKGNALRAEDEDVDDADLERLGAPDDKGDADG